MAFLSSINIVGSGLTAQQMRLDVIAENVTNSSTTRTENGGAYRRKMVVFQAESSSESFKDVMARATGRITSSNQGSSSGTAGGVKVTQIVEDQSDLKLVYDPTHPDANEEGYVEYPNVDMVKEIADAMAASQAYSANVTAFNALKSVASKAMEIGR